MPKSFIPDAPKTFQPDSGAQLSPIQPSAQPQPNLGTRVIHDITGENTAPAQGALATIAQNTIGSRGLAGMAQMPGRVAGQIGLQGDLPHAYDSSNLAADAAIKLLKMARETEDPVLRAKLHDAAIASANNSHQAFHNANELSQNTFTPEQAAGTTLNAAGTVASFAKLPAAASSVVGRIGAGAAQQGASGAAMSAGQSMQNNGSAGDVARSGILGGVGGAVLGAGAAGVSELSALKPSIIGGLAHLSGYDQTVIQRALQRTPGAVAGTKQGETALNDIITRTNTGLQKYANETLAESQNKIAELSKLSGGGKGFPGTRQALLGAGTDFVNGTTKMLRDNNIGVSKTGTLTFDRATSPSRIVSGGDEKAVQDAFTALSNIRKDTSIANIDAVLERLMVLRAKTPVGSPTGAETKSIIGDMMENIVGFTRSLANGTRSVEAQPVYKQYADFLQENLPKRVFINEAKEIFGGSRNLSAKDTSKIAIQMMQLFNTGRSALRGLGDKIGATVGEDIVGGAAGTLVNTGDKFSVRAQNLTQRGIVAKLAEYLPRAAVKNYIATGSMTGHLLDNHIITFASDLLGIAPKAVLNLLIQAGNQPENQ